MGDTGRIGASAEPARKQPALFGGDRPRRSRARLAAQTTAFAPKALRSHSECRRPWRAGVLAFRTVCEPAQFATDCTPLACSPAVEAPVAARSAAQEFAAAA